MVLALPSTVQRSDGQYINIADSFDANGKLGTYSTIQQPTDIQSAFSEVVAFTTTALGASATYTSQAIDMFAENSFCTRLVANFSTNQDSVLKVQISVDAVTWFDIRVNAAAKFGEIDIRPAARYVRVVLTNGATAQGSLILSVMRTVL